MRARERGERVDERPIAVLIAQERRAERLARNAEYLGVTGKKPKVEDPGPGVDLWNIGAGPLFKMTLPAPEDD